MERGGFEQAKVLLWLELRSARHREIGTPGVPSQATDGRTSFKPSDVRKTLRHINPHKSQAALTNDRASRCRDQPPFQHHHPKETDALRTTLRLRLQPRSDTVLRPPWVQSVYPRGCTANADPFSAVVGVDGVLDARRQSPADALTCGITNDSGLVMISSVPQICKS